MRYNELLDVYDQSMCTYLKLIIVKVAVRNVRRDSVDKIKLAEKDKQISKDDSKGFQDDLQKVTDDNIKKLDEILKVKEKDLMKI